ncbi:MAG: TlpA disulfide reductase family protein [Pseudomonadota bacterium]|nr:TlpA disulfide reductase family protein [Pseudomonadota bacterium]
MKRTALLTLTLSSAAIIAYLSYRMLLQPAVTPTGEIATPAEPVEILPDFTLEDLAGGTRSIRSWPDNALIINFWATWCAPCRREIPLLKDFQSAHAEESVQVIGIAVDRLEPVKEFARDIEFNYPVLVGQSDAMDAASAFGVDFFALPFTVFTDTEGNILGVHTGEVHLEDLENLSQILADLATHTTDLATARARLADFL